MKAVEHTLCKSREHLQEELDTVLDAGGEGLMLRKAGSLCTSSSALVVSYWVACTLTFSCVC